MFGFKEADYEVVRQFSRPRRGTPQGTAHYELRQNRVTGNRYLAVFSKGEAGETLSDFLFYYRSNELAEVDFTALCGESPLRVRDLQFEVRVEDHKTGYSRDGTLIRY